MKRFAIFRAVAVLAVAFGFGGAAMADGLDNHCVGALNHDLKVFNTTVNITGDCVIAVTGFGLIIQKSTVNVFSDPASCGDSSATCEAGNLTITGTDTTKTATLAIVSSTINVEGDFIMEMEEGDVKVDGSTFTVGGDGTPTDSLNTVKTDVRILTDGDINLQRSTFSFDENRAVTIEFNTCNACLDGGGAANVRGISVFDSFSVTVGEVTTTFDLAIDLDIISEDRENSFKGNILSELDSSDTVDIISTEGDVFAHDSFFGGATVTIDSVFGDCSTKGNTPDAVNLLCPPPPVDSADLSVTVLSDLPDPVIVGNNLTYTVTVTNNGPDPATGVTLNDKLPTSVDFVSVLPSGSCSPKGKRTVRCNLGSLADGASAMVTIEVTPKKVGTITNTASVSAKENDPDTTNNSITVVTTVN